jgi:toxin ParE1/3/4
MRRFRFSRRAEADLLSIGDYTLRKWGTAQAARYLGELEGCCQILADNPALGRLCDEVRPGLRRHEHGKHVLFYRQEHGGILVSRVLHQRMLPERHAIDDQDDENVT